MKDYLRNKRKSIFLTPYEATCLGILVQVLSDKKEVKNILKYLKGVSKRIAIALIQYPKGKSKYKIEAEYLINWHQNNLTKSRYAKSTI